MTYPTNRDEAAAKEAAARDFDRWADAVGGLVSWGRKPPPTENQVALGEKVVWSGESARRFLVELQPVKNDLGKIAVALRQTAKNLRQSALELNRRGERNQ